MQITPTSDLPDQPDPIFDNTDEDGVDFSVRRTLDTPVIFDETTTFFRRLLEVGFLPCVEKGESGVAINDIREPLCIGSMDLGRNNIGMKVGRVKVQILEHVIGALAGLGIDADIFLKSSVFPFHSVSLPTKANCVQEYVERLLKPELFGEEGARKTFTVAQPTRVDFGNKRGSYAVLFPAEGNHELIVDVMVSYPGALGTQRARVKITEDVIQRYLAGARTPSYGSRRRLMGILDRFPVLQRIVNIDSSRTVSLDKNGVMNPRGEYDFNGGNIELLMHEVLDKLGAYGIPLNNGARFVGTIMLFASSHGHDLGVMQAFQNGGIKIIHL